MHYEPGYAYPLIIWLHGELGNEQQLRRVMPLVSMRNYVAIAPRGTFGDRVRRSAFSWRQTTGDVEEAENRIFECIAVAERRFNIHSRRIFLAGLGCGGTMAMRMAWNSSRAICRSCQRSAVRCPTEDRPLRNVNRLRQLPCFVATARESLAYPESDVCRDLRLMHSAGCTVALRQYPASDELTTQMLADLDRWVMGIVCPSVSSCA